MKLQGIRYEKKVKRMLEDRWKTNVNYHKWIRFFDNNGVGHAEPEMFVILKDRILLVEVKLTGGIAGQMQLEGLYRPLLERIFGLPVYSLLVCKNVNQATPKPMFASPEDFLRSGRRFGVWQWLG